MKRILILIIGLIGVAYGQSSPTSSKTRFVNGLYVGTKLDAYFNAADSNAIYWRADSVVMAKYKGTARALAFAVSGGYIPYSDTTTLFGQVVRTFGTQTVGGNKTFSNDIVVNGLTVGRGTSNTSGNTVLGASALSTSNTLTSATAIGNDALRSATSGGNNTAVGNQSLRTSTSGTNNTAVGSRAMFSTTTGNDNTSLGYDALYSNTSGGSNTALGQTSLRTNTTGSQNTAVGLDALFSNNTTSSSTAVGYQALRSSAAANNTAVGHSALSLITSGADNTALGVDAGRYISGFSSNLTGSNSIFIGYRSKAAANGQTNQTVIGYDAEGNGSNTVTIGNSSVTGNYFNGFLKQTSVTSALVKASATGQFEAAVAGTDYAPAVAGGYLPLSGGTLTGALSGTSAYFNTTGFFGQTLTLDENLVFANAQGRMRIGATNFAIQKNDGSANYVVLDNATGNMTLTGALSGTSLSMSGATQLATSSGNVLIKTTTDNGTDALQVAGSAIATSLKISGGTSTQALIADGSVQTLTSGTYTPTLTNTTNITSSTLSNATYNRIGDIVTVYITASASPTANGTSELTFTLPVNTTTPNYTLTGSGINSAPTIQAVVRGGGSGTSVGAKFVGVAGDTHTISITFQYTVN